mgnify:CR=1 FL=1
MKKVLTYTVKNKIHNQYKFYIALSGYRHSVNINP